MRKTLSVLVAGCLTLAACSGSSGASRQTRAVSGAFAPGGRPSGEPSGAVQPGPQGIQYRPTGKPNSQPVHGTVPVNQTVLGMHFVQMRSTVAPVAEVLRSQIESGTVAPPESAQLQQITSAVTQFDSAASRIVAPAGMAGQIRALVAADGVLLGQLESMGRGSAISPAATAALNSAIAGWQSALDQAGSALSA